MGFMQMLSNYKPTWYQALYFIIFPIVMCDLVSINVIIFLYDATFVCFVIMKLDIIIVPIWDLKHIIAMLLLLCLWDELLLENSSRDHIYIEVLCAYHLGLWLFILYSFVTLFYLSCVHYILWWIIFYPWIII